MRTHSADEVREHLLRISNDLAKAQTLVAYEIRRIANDIHLGDPSNYKATYMDDIDRLGSDTVALLRQFQEVFK